jgi:hypothetical protein
MKLKKCKVCKESFEPKQLFQICCGYKCAIIHAKELKRLKDTREWNAEKKVLKEKLTTPDNYRAKNLQPTINKIARFIDYGCSCIATDNFGKLAGGHNISVGANRSTALNLHNIHIQSFASNSFKGGDTIKYHKGIVKRYGKEYLEFMDSLHKTPKISLSYNEMVIINTKAKKIALNLSKNLTELNPEERINLRNQINIDLGIYSEEFCLFKTNETKC